MNALFRKLKNLEMETSRERGRYQLFALFLREDSVDLWDLVVSAPWIDSNKGSALRYLSERLNRVASSLDLTQLARIVVIPADDPAIQQLGAAVQVEHGGVRIENSSFAGMRLQQAFIVTVGPATKGPGIAHAELVGAQPAA